MRFSSWLSVRRMSGNLPGHTESRRRPTRPCWWRLCVERLEDRLAPASAQMQQAYGQLPLSFEANVGQTAAQVQYLSSGNGYALFLTSTGAVLSLTQPAAGGTAKTSPLTSTTGVALAMNLVGANPQASVSGLDKQAGVSNYFIGNDPSQWHTNIANYSQVEYQDVYPGVNLVYYGNQQQLEYDFVVAPGAKPSNIQLNFQGQDSMSLDAQGDLVLHTATGDVLQHAPVVYQEINGVRQTVSGQFVLGTQGQVSFQVGAYDKGLPLTIDPMLVYSTYLGGNSEDDGLAIAVDGSGNAYVTGDTESTNFPTTTGAFQASPGGGYDAFVTKLNAAGTAINYSTYLGGNGADYGYRIAVDGAGSAYVTGFTQSSNFPTTAGAFQTSHGSDGGLYDAFVTKLNATGTALSYSTYLGGNNQDEGSGIAVDGAGNAYVTGYTSSTNFPTTTGAFQTNYGGAPDAFVTKLNATGTTLVYSTYLGGSGGARANGLAVDASGNAYITGYTYSSNFPTTAGAFQTSSGGTEDAFVTKLNAAGAALIYSTYLGGDSYDDGYAIAVDGAGSAYVTGFTQSSNFPTTAGAFQSSHASDGGTDDAFVTELNAAGTALSYSTYLGGNQFDLGTGIAVDSAGNAYVIGYTASTDFPTTAGAFQTSHGSDGGLYDAFVTKLNATGTALSYSTYLGGNNQDEGSGIAVDGAGNAYVTGYTSSTNFPTTTGAFQTSYSGGQDAAFVAKFGLASPTTTTLTANGPNPSLVGQSVGFTVQVSPAPPDGESVSLEDASNGNVVVGTGTLTNGSATITLSSLAVGVHNLVAVYGGDGPNLGSTSSPVTQTVNQLWNEFNGNAQHTGISSVAAQPTDQILWQTSVNLQGSYFWHTGEPVFTPNDTVIVPVKVTSSGQQTGTANYELEAFNGNTGTLLWTVTSEYIAVSNGWLPPYQPVYDPITNHVYFPGLGGTLEYISNPDNPGSSTPTPTVEEFYGTYTSAYDSSIYIDTPLTVDNAGDIFFGFQETGSNPAGITDGGIARVSATGAGSYVTATVATGAGSGAPAVGSAPALSNDGSTLYVAIADSAGSYLVGVNATTLAHEYSVILSVPNAGTGVYLIGISTAAPMVAPDGTVYLGVYPNTSNGSRGFMTHYSADLATEYTPGAFGWDDTPSIIPASMVPSYTGTSSYLILTKYNNYVAGEVGSYGGNGVNEIAILDPNATQTDPNNDPNPNMLVMKQIMTITSPTEDSEFVNNGYPDATREWCTNGTAVDPSSDSVFINNEDGYSYRWNLATDTITQAVEITNGYGEPYTPTAIGPNGVVYAINGGTLFALGGYSNYTLTTVSSLTPAVAGQAVTFTTTLASTDGGAVPTGSVTYSYTTGVNNPLNSTPVTLGTMSLVNGVATFTTSALLPDHYHIIASYSGDMTDGYAAGSTTLVQVILGNPTVSLTTSASPVLVGQSVTFTATVNPDGVFFVPLGTVSFMDGSTLLGTVALNALDQSTSPSSSQVATFTTSSLPAGSDSITAVYSGDLNFAGSTSDPVAQVVNVQTATTLAASPNPVLVGAVVTLTATVSPNPGNLGTVTFLDNGVALPGASAVAVVNGVATFQISTLSGGTHPLTAVYSGATGFTGSTSPTVTQSVVSTFQVDAATLSGNYVQLVFDGPIDPNTTQLYYSPGTTAVAPDVTVTGPSGSVKGSLVIDATNPNVATFVATAGQLAAGNYTVAVTTAVQALGGATLAANYSQALTAAPVTPVLTAANVARGPGETVNVPNTSTGLPITLSGLTAAVQSASFTLTYDPTILTVTAATLSSDAATNGNLVLNPITFTSIDAHHMQIAFTVVGGSGGGHWSPTGGAGTLLTLTATVPSNAPYTQKALLATQNVVINGTAAQGDDAVDVNAYPGDVDGSHTYSGLDATLISRVTVGGGTGFSVFKDLDPWIIGSVTGSSTLSVTGLDATDVSRAVVGSYPGVIPPLSTGITITGATGPDPRLYLAAASGSAGQTVTVQERLDVTAQSGVEVDALDSVIEYDPTKFTVANIRAGSLLPGYLVVSNIDAVQGVIRVTEFTTSPVQAAHGTDGAVLLLDFTVKARATPGRSPLVLAANDGGTTTAAYNTAGALTLSPAPRNPKPLPIRGDTVTPFVAGVDSFFTIVGPGGAPGSLPAPIAVADGNSPVTRSPVIVPGMSAVQPVQPPNNFLPVAMPVVSTGTVGTLPLLIATDEFWRRYGDPGAPGLSDDVATDENHAPVDAESLGPADYVWSLAGEVLTSATGTKDTSPSEPRT